MPGVPSVFQRSLAREEQTDGQTVPECVKCHTLSPPQIFSKLPTSINFPPLDVMMINELLFVIPKSLPIIVDNIK